MPEVRPDTAKEKKASFLTAWRRKLRVHVRRKKKSAMTPKSEASEEKPEHASEYTDDAPERFASVAAGTVHKNKAQVTSVSEHDASAKSRRGVWLFTGGLLGTVVLLLVVLVVGIYFLDWRQPVVKKIAEIVPLPAGWYEYQPIWAKDYWSDIDTLKYFYQYQVAAGNYKQMPANTELEDTSWDRLVNIKMVDEIARQYGVSVGTDEVNKEIDSMVQEAGSRTILSDSLYSYYHWDISTFERKVIAPYLLEQKVAKKLQADPVYVQQVKDQAQRVLNLVKASPGKFADYAKQYSNDTQTADKGGELGYFNKGVMSKEFDNVAFAMSPGDISGLVKTGSGYEIIKVEDKKVDKANPDNDQIKASYILIAFKTSDQILSEIQKTKHVVRWLH